MNENTGTIIYKNTTFIELIKNFRPENIVVLHKKNPNFPIFKNKTLIMVDGLGAAKVLCNDKGSPTSTAIQAQSPGGIPRP